MSPAPPQYNSCQLCLEPCLGCYWKRSGWGLLMTNHDFPSLGKEKEVLWQVRPSHSLHLGNKLQRKGTSLLLCDP